jgi:hypothetical protein
VLEISLSFVAYSHEFFSQESTALRHFSIERQTDTRESSPVQQIFATDLVTDLLIGNKANAVVIGFMFSRFSATKKARKQEKKNSKQISCEH